ncbi:carbohydrate ABC transporter permease [Geochorda subterranea]|uniref:Sugar ABC transporter permease n=1 Tax=Geochorda subterranea TaxID=3109564 RepID=A0ABZ1BNS3_9FIRM|nr:sugar ABC transporter permease [Limnochorda sp. LNt]WRP14484.1 sugar ABC transporter permease [Limnochorda sp. LNt]
MSRRRQVLLFLALATPVVVLRLATSLYPLLHTLYLSAFESSLLAGSSQYVGLRNYVEMWRDPAIRDSVSFTVLFVLGSTLLELVLAFPLALLLNASFRGRRLARTVNLLPWAIPTVVAAIGFRWFFDDQYGMFVDAVHRLAGVRPAILVDPWPARLAVIGANVWKNTPFLAVILLAGLQGVPKELYEAAVIDGASAVQCTRYITLPFCAGLLSTLGIFFILWQLASFDLVYGMTQGGPGTATSVVSYRILQLAVLWFNYGMASALSVVLFLLVLVVGVMGVTLLRRFDVGL